jgi:pilus assembly protein Flp/PilA
MQIEQEVDQSELRKSRPLRGLLTCRRGQGLVEYALILVLVAIVVIVVLSQLGTQIYNAFNDVVNTLRG